MKNSLTSWN